MGSETAGEMSAATPPRIRGHRAFVHESSETTVAVVEISG
jgi:hypothetical protein